MKKVLALSSSLYLLDSVLPSSRSHLQAEYISIQIRGLQSGCCSNLWLDSTSTLGAELDARQAAHGDQWAYIRLHAQA